MKQITTEGFRSSKNGGKGEIHDGTKYQRLFRNRTAQNTQSTGTICRFREDSWGRRLSQSER
ncbi:hypothetical protein Bmyc01_46180 [Bacillus mycoides]|nr:hypothetical protein Bmyc01_46180 [Bacillus mycoides]